MSPRTLLRRSSRTVTRASVRARTPSATSRLLHAEGDVDCGSQWISRALGHGDNGAMMLLQAGTDIDLLIDTSHGTACFRNRLGPSLSGPFTWDPYPTMNCDFDSGHRDAHEMEMDDFFRASCRLTVIALEPGYLAVRSVAILHLDQPHTRCAAMSPQRRCVVLRSLACHGLGMSRYSQDGKDGVLVFCRSAYTESGGSRDVASEAKQGPGKDENSLFKR